MSALILAAQIAIIIAGILAVAYGAFVAIVTPEINEDALDARLAAGQPTQTSIFDREVYDWFHWLPGTK